MGTLSIAQRNDLKADIVVGLGGPALMKKYDISQPTLSKYRRIVNETMAEAQKVVELSALLETLQRAVVEDLTDVRTTVMTRFRTARDANGGDGSEDLARRIDEVLKTCAASASVFNRVAIYIDAHTESTTEIHVHQVAEQGVMRKILDAKGEDGEPLLSDESRARVLAFFADPRGRGTA